MGELIFTSHYLGQRSSRVGQNQTPQTDEADQPPRIFFLDDVEVIDHVRRLGHFAKPGDRLGDGQILCEYDKFGRHQTAGRVVVEVH